MARINGAHGLGPCVLVVLVACGMDTRGGGHRLVRVRSAAPPRPSEPGVLRATPVDLDLGVLGAAGPPTFELELEPGKLVTVERLRVEQEAADDYTWFGRTGTRGFVELVVAGGAVTGTADTGFELFQIIPEQAGHVIVRRDRAKLPPAHPPGFAAVEARAGIIPSDTAPSASKVSASTEWFASDQTTITLLVAYTTAVRVARPDVKSMIKLAIAETNSANANSGVLVTFELAHAYEVAYQEHPDFETNLARFAGTADDAMDDVHLQRLIRRADLAILLLDCHSTYLGMARRVMAPPEDAFAAVDYRYATGYYTFAHEIGHLMGLRHDVEADDEATPFPDGHGFVGWSSMVGWWGTLMAVTCGHAAGCWRRPYWSNPSLLVDGQPAGDRWSNATRVLNSVAKAVSNYR